MLRTIPLLLILLGVSSGASAAVTGFAFTEVPQTLLPDHKMFDLTVTGTGQLTGMEMLANLTTGSFYQSPGRNGETRPQPPNFPPTPPVEVDTFVAIGPETSPPVQPVIPGGVYWEETGEFNAVTFNATKLDIVWAPPGAYPVMNPTDYFIGRLVIEEGSRGSIALAGLTFQQPHYFAPVVNVADLLGEIEQVPEPSTLAATSLGMLGLWWCRRRAALQRVENSR